MEDTKNNSPTSNSGPGSGTNSTPNSTHDNPVNSTPTSNNNNNNSPNSDNPENPNSDRRHSHNNNTNTDTSTGQEHSDSTMSNPVNDKVDTSEKTNDTIDNNSAFDLSYFDGIYKTKEKDDPLDLSYLESPYDKNKIEEYLKRNVESGNQLAYTQEDLNEAGRNLQRSLDNFTATMAESGIFGGVTVPGAVSFNGSDLALDSRPTDIAALASMNGDVMRNTYGNITSKEEAKQKIREQHPTIANNITDNLLNAWAERIVANNKQKQIQEDMGRNGPTANRGMSKAEEMDLLERAASDYDSLNEAEKRKVDDAALYWRSFGGSNGLIQPPEPLNPLEPANSRNNRAIAERNREREERGQRLNNFLNSRVDEILASALRGTSTTPTTSTTPASTRETPTTRTETPRTSTSEPARTTSTRTESVPETPRTSEPVRTEETASAPTRTEETPTTEERPETPTHPETSVTEETPEEPTVTEDTPTITEDTSTEIEDEIPETIDEGPSEETHTVMDVIEDLDDGSEWWKHGTATNERVRRQIKRVSPTAEKEFMDFAQDIEDIMDGTAGQKVKAVLKLVSKAAWDTFNIIPKMCGDMVKDVVYRLIKGDYDISGLTDAEQKQVERFTHNKKNVAMMNSMLNTMNKPIESSIRGKGKGQATDESDYNEGITETANDVVSDVTKKYIISQPWLFKAIQRW